MSEERARNVFVCLRVKQAARGEASGRMISKGMCGIHHQKLLIHVTLTSPRWPVQDVAKCLPWHLTRRITEVTRLHFYGCCWRLNSSLRPRKVNEPVPQASCDSQQWLTVQCVQWASKCVLFPKVQFSLRKRRWYRVWKRSEGTTQTLVLYSYDLSVSHPWLSLNSIAWLWHNGPLPKLHFLTSPFPRIQYVKDVSGLSLDQCEATLNEQQW